MEFTGTVMLGNNTQTWCNSTLKMLINLAEMKHPIRKLKAIAEHRKIAVPS